MILEGYCQVKMPISEFFIDFLKLFPISAFFFFYLKKFLNTIDSAD